MRFAVSLIVGAILGVASFYVADSGQTGGMHSALWFLFTVTLVVPVFGGLAYFIKTTFDADVDVEDATPMRERAGRGFRVALSVLLGVVLGLIFSLFAPWRY